MTRDGNDTSALAPRSASATPRDVAPLQQIHEPGTRWRAVMRPRPHAAYAESRFVGAPELF